jgi:thiosulfate/3-mercaptopyruvate sulfurtransferase
MKLRHVLPLLALFAQPVLAQGGAGLLLTPTQLNAEIRDPRLVLLYVGTREDYGAGHIAGARFIGMEDVSVDPRLAGLPLELPDDADLRQRLEKFGISDNSKIVIVFGAGYKSPSTRIAWSLQVAGLGAQTRYLDGGTVAWKSAGLPLTTAEPVAATPGKLTLATDRSIVVDYRWVRAHAKSPGIRLIDGRAPVFFEGPGMESQGRKVEAGHIAGAKNLPFNTFADDSGRFLPIDQLRQRFASAGVQPGDTVVAYCHVGQQATVVLFSARLLGHPIRLYDGSMADWEQRKLPLENATAPKPPEPK